MELRQDFVVQASPERVWDALKDFELIAACVPGTEILAVSEDGAEVTGRITAKVGPISAAFTGSAKVARDEGSRSGEVEGTGADRASNSRATVRMTYSVHPQGTATRTDIVADLQLKGTLAQFSKGPIIHDIAAAMTRDFATNLQARLDAHDVGALPRAKPMNPLVLLWRIIMARLSGSARGTAGRGPGE